MCVEGSKAATVCGGHTEPTQRPLPPALMSFLLPCSDGTLDAQGPSLSKHLRYLFNSVPFPLDGELLEVTGRSTLLCSPQLLARATGPAHSRYPNDICQMQLFLLWLPLPKSAGPILCISSASHIPQMIRKAQRKKALSEVKFQCNPWLDLQDTSPAGLSQLWGGVIPPSRAGRACLLQEQLSMEGSLGVDRTHSTQHWDLHGVTVVSVCCLNLAGYLFVLFPHYLYSLPTPFSLGLRCPPLEKQERSVRKAGLSIDPLLLYTLEEGFWLTSA